MKYPYPTDLHIKPMTAPSSVPFGPEPWAVPPGPSRAAPWGGQPGTAAPEPWNFTPLAPAPLNPPGPQIPAGPWTLPSIAFPKLEYAPANVEEHPLYKRISESIAAIPKRFAKKQVKRTHIIFVLDTSGSMVKGKEITISGFNEQVDIVTHQKKGAGRTTVSLILFSNTVSVPYEYKTTKALVKLTDSNYSPDGMTALYDGVGTAMEKIIEARGFKEKNTAFFVAILTDGGENLSRSCDGALISKCMSMLQDTGRVTFSFMGPNKQLHSIADVIKTAPGNTAGFNPESLKSRTEAFASMATATRSYLSARSEGLNSVCNLYTGGKSG